MKYLLLLIIVVLTLGCGTQLEDREENGQNSYGKVHYSGHTYILFVGVNKGSMIHDPDCSCGRK